MFSAFLVGCASPTQKELARDLLQSKYGMSLDDESAFRRAIDENNTPLVKAFARAHGHWPFMTDAETLETVDRLVKMNRADILLVVYESNKNPEKLEKRGLEVLMREIDSAVAGDRCRNELLELHLRLAQVPNNLEPLLKQSCADGLLLILEDSPNAALSFFKSELENQIAQAKSKGENALSDPLYDKSKALPLREFIEQFRKSYAATCGRSYKAEDCRVSSELEKLLSRIHTSRREIENFVATERSKRPPTKEEKAKAAEQLMDDACQIIKNIAFQQSRIDDENKAGKISGAVNLRVLNGAGSMIVDYGKNLKRIERQYKAMAGRPLDTNAAGKRCTVMGY